MDSRAFNQQLDHRLARTGRIDEALFRQRVDAYTYDVATSVMA